jgi:putative ABC transport system permease protein
VLGLLLGAGLLLVFHRSVGYYFETIAVGVAWPGPLALALDAVGCALAAGVVGLAGAALPAWRASREDPFALVRSEGN